MQYRKLLPFFLPGIFACSDPVTQPNPVSYRLLDESAYAGAPIRIIATGLASTDTPAIFADTSRLELLSRSADTLVVALPGSARGEYAVTAGSSRMPVGFVQVRGYVGRRTLPTIAFEWIVSPARGSATIIGGMDDGLWQVTLGSNTGQRLLPRETHPIGTMPSIPGITYRNGVVLLQPREGPLELWQLKPAPQRLGTVPLSSAWASAQLSDSTLLFLSKRDLEVFRVRDGVRTSLWRAPSGFYGQSRYAIISPNGELATARFYYAPNGVPVIDAATGAKLYDVPNVYHYYEGAAFSENGDTLWILGGNTSEASLFAFKARTGQELHRITWPGAGAVDVTLDYAGGRLLVALTYDDGTHLLDVDPNTYRTRSEAVAHGIVDCCGLMAVDAFGIFIVGYADFLQFDY